MPQFRIGISGWTYAPWRGKFYPRGLSQKRELEYAATQLNSIEINGTFYSLQRPTSFRAWHDETPNDFVFAIKGSRYITHMKRLKDVQMPLANFFASGVLALDAKLGPILWQFPERMRFDAERFEAFFSMLPTNTDEASQLARRNDGRVKGDPVLKSDRKRRIRHAVEVRSESFLNDEFIRMLRRYDIAWVIADAANRWPYFEEITAPFVYIRLHGAKELYASGYGDDELEAWAKRIRSWSRGAEPRDAVKFTTLKPRKRASRDVYVYFDNDAKVHAPFNAMRLAEMLQSDSRSSRTAARGAGAGGRHPRTGVRGQSGT